MRILMLTSSYPKYAGETTAPFIEEIAASVVARGHCVHLLAPYRPDIRREPIERGVHLHFFRYAPHPALNVWGYAAAQRGDVRLKGSALLATPFALTATIVSLFRMQQAGFDLIHAHWVLPNGVPAALVAAWRGVPLVVSLHGSDVAVAERHWAAAGAAGFAFRQAAAVTACSADLRDRALLLGARQATSRIIPYSVNTQTFQPQPNARELVRAELGLEAGSPLVLALGRMVYKKGFDLLLAAWPAVLARHPAARLVLVGDGDLRQDLTAQAAALGLGNTVQFPGQLDRERTASYLGSADIFVVPSVRDQSGNVDGLPNVLLEGMAAGRPIVASRLAGIPQVITNGTHGLLVPERDPAALAAAIVRLLDTPALAQQLGAAARRRAEAELTPEATAAQWEAVYRQAGARTQEPRT